MLNSKYKLLFQPFKILLFIYNVQNIQAALNLSNVSCSIYRVVSILNSVLKYLYFCNVQCKGAPYSTAADPTANFILQTFLAIANASDIDLESFLLQSDSKDFVMQSIDNLSRSLSVTSHRFPTTN